MPSGTPGAPTPPPRATSTPETGPSVVREYLILTGARVDLPPVGQPVRFSSGGDFIVLMRFGGELYPFKVVRVAQ